MKTRLLGQLAETIPISSGSDEQSADYTFSHSLEIPTETTERDALNIINKSINQKQKNTKLRKHKRRGFIYKRGRIKCFLFRSFCNKRQG
uniref:Uncharacterized protein n=1 Tax=Octopus bimaculoides TaxID=37653 RepID=A0A0L8GG31_OCTBM